MTVSSTVRKAGPFAGNGVTTAFPFTFKVFSENDLRLTKTDAAGNESVLTLDAQYSVALNADQDASPGGTITYPLSGVPLAAGEVLVALDTTPATQGTKLSNLGRYLPKVVEDAFDRVTILTQRLLEQTSRGLVVPASDTGAPAAIPSSGIRKGKFLGFDAVGNPIALSGTGADAALRTDLAGGAGSSLMGFAPGLVNSGSRTAQSKLSEFVSIKDFLCADGQFVQGDGVHDDTTGIQRAINAVAAGGTLLVPATSAYYLLTGQLVLAGQFLVGQWGGYRTGPMLRTNSLTTPLIVTTQGSSSGLRNLSVQGIPTSTGLIELNGVDAVSNLKGNFSGRYGIQLTATSIASLVEDVVLINMVSDRTGATQFGAIDVNGTDHYINRVEANCASGQTGTVSANKVAVSIYVRGANHFISNSIGEFGEQGWVLAGTKCRVITSRADRCMGDGFSLTGSQNIIDGLQVMECGTVAANTYDGFVATGPLNTMSNLQIATQGTSVLRYGVNDLVASATQKNRYIEPLVSASVGTARYNWAASQPSGFTLAHAPSRATNGATTLDVSQVTDVRLGYTAPATVTAITNGIPCQTVTFYVATGTSTVTFQQNATIKNRSGADTAVTAGQTISYRFLPDENLWAQL